MVVRSVLIQIVSTKGFVITKFTLIFSLNFFMMSFEMVFQHGIPEKFAPANVTNKNCSVKMLIQMSRNFDVLTNSGNPGAKITFNDIIIMNIQMFLQSSLTFECFSAVSAITHEFYTTTRTFSVMRFHMFLTSSKLPKNIFKS